MKICPHCGHKHISTHRLCEACLTAALERYTDPNHPEYDAEFDKEIRRLRPDWFDKGGAQ